MKEAKAKMHCFRLPTWLKVELNKASAASGLTMSDFMMQAASQSFPAMAFSVPGDHDAVVCIRWPPATYKEVSERADAAGVEAPEFLRRAAAMQCMLQRDGLTL